SGYFHGRLAHALQDLSEVVEHVVDRVRDIAQRVIGDLAAQRQVAARYLVDDAQQLGDAPLQGVIRILVARRLGDLGHGAVQVVRNVDQLVVRIDSGAGAGLTRGVTLRDSPATQHGP